MQQNNALSHSRDNAVSNRRAVWVARAGQPLQVGSSSDGRWIRLREGRLWLTLGSASTIDASANCWLLQAGQSMRLAPGVGAAVEGWPSARFELIEMRQTVNGAAA